MIRGMFMNEKKQKAIRIVLIVLVAAVGLFLCIRYAVPLTRLLATEEGREEICGKVRSFGVFAPIVFILLMVLQIVIAFIPGGPLEVIGGMLFGGGFGLLYTVVGALLGTLAVYGLVRAFGRPLVQIFANEEKMQHLRFLQDEEKLEFWVFLLFLIPGIPKDMLTYFVPLTPMKGRQFILLSTLARLPSLAASVLVGDSLADGRYWLCIVICVIAAIAGFAGYRLKAHLAKKKGGTQ